MLKNILVEFTELYDMTFMYFGVEDKLFVYIKTIPSCIQKRELKLCFCLWTCVAWPRISESTFHSKISFQNSWKTTQLSKMVRNNVPLTVHQFEHNDLSPMFPDAVYLLNLLEAPSLFREHLIFSMIFKL